jgi:hypothetical protein
MKIRVLTYRSGKEDSLGLIFIDGVFMGYTLEDEERTVKVFGETRIPRGTYEVKLRTEGGHNARYLEKFGAEFHKGMLHVINVPNFKWILIHIGNTDDDTAGCLLVGDQPNKFGQKGFISGSTSAYKRIYPIVAKAIESGERVWITYIDYKTHI